MTSLVEKKKNKGVCKMPVRKFFNNTFGNNLNDGLYQLQKKQEKNPDQKDLFKKKGMVKFIAEYMMDQLPEYEKDPSKAQGLDEEVEENQ